MHILYAFLISIGLGFGWLWADQIKWISEGLPPKEKRAYTYILWVIYTALMFGAMTLGWILHV
jgi:hypothetical protein